MKSERAKALNETLFNASLACAVLCITILSLFTVMDKRALYIVDEVFAVSNFLFIAVTCLCFKGFSEFNLTMFKLTTRLFWLALLSLLFASSALAFLI